MVGTDGILPRGDAPPALPVRHFPSRLHAFVWRNWGLVPKDVMARVVGGTPEAMDAIGTRMGLAHFPVGPEDQRRRAYITVIRRNWHLLPYEQLLEVLDWTTEELAFALREDDFLFIKLGRLKPHAEPLTYHEPTGEEQEREQAIRRIVERHLASLEPDHGEPLFSFLGELTARRPNTGTAPQIRRSRPPQRFRPRFSYSYFAPYGDPLLDPLSDPYPEGYLERLAESGVDGVWLQGVLQKLSPFPWDPRRSQRFDERRHNLDALVERAARYGIGVFLYLNEPRCLPVEFFADHPDLQGVVEGADATLCTSHPDVANHLTTAVADLCRAVPSLAGFVTITFSENLTNCWSHGKGAQCPRCRDREPADVLAGVNDAFLDGIRMAGTGQDLLVWDWEWPPRFAEDVIERLHPDCWFVSVSEKGVPIERGGESTISREYAMSVPGPSEQAIRRWGIARGRGMRTIAKIQVANTWELSSVPYIPVPHTVAHHLARLNDGPVDGLMLSWTLGGYPCPSLHLLSEMDRALDEEGSFDPDAAVLRIAERLYGPRSGRIVEEAWRMFSGAFMEFPFHNQVLYNAPLHSGPANLLWEEATGYAASMVGLPYDDLDGWRAIYPADTFIAQLELVTEAFEQGVELLRSAVRAAEPGSEWHEAARDESRIAEACSIYLRSTINQSRFILARRALEERAEPAAAQKAERLLRHEIELSQRLCKLQLEDSRLGFEASNHYVHVPLDLLEKILNCEDLLERWLPTATQGAANGAV